MNYLASFKKKKKYFLKMTFQFVFLLMEKRGRIIKLSIFYVDVLLVRVNFILTSKYWRHRLRTNPHQCQSFKSNCSIQKSKCLNF